MREIPKGEKRKEVAKEYLKKWGPVTSQIYENNLHIQKIPQILGRINSDPHLDNPHG